MDLLDLWRGGLSLRRVSVLLAGLPIESATSRALAPEFIGWTVDSFLLAQVIDTLQAANWQRGGDEHTPRPKPFPRPGDVDKDAEFTEHKRRVMERKIAERRQQRALEGGPT